MNPPSRRFFIFVVVSTVLYIRWGFFLSSLSSLRRRSAAGSSRNETEHDDDRETLEVGDDHEYSRDTQTDQVVVKGILQKEIKKTAVPRKKVVAGKAAASRKRAIIEHEQEEEEDDDDDDAGDDGGPTYIKEEKWRKQSLQSKPRSKFTYWDMHAYFSCTEKFSKERPLYSAESWMRLRDFYNEFARKDREARGDMKDGLRRSYKFSEKTFSLPLEGYQTHSDRGRSTRAKRDIAKGEIVNMNYNNTVYWRSGDAFRRFVFGLHDRPDEFESGTSCDILVWSWVQQLDNNKSGKEVIVSALDDSSFMNNGGKGKVNVDCGKGTIDYAKRNIAKGEEVMCSYGDFASGSWTSMGL